MPAKPKVKPIWIVLSPPYEPGDKNFYGVVFGDRCEAMARKFMDAPRRKGCRLVRGWHTIEAEGK